MRKKDIQILKSRGSLEKFSKKKLTASLKRCGLSPRSSKEITETVAREIRDGDRTLDIYRRTLPLVRRKSPLAGVHYSLKKALLALGPTGHHFESFVARYFEELGFETSVSKTFQGRLVSHEVDVVASLKGKRYFVECKFHNRPGIKNDVKVALYVKARWDDLREGAEGKNLHGFYLASNTAFTKDAQIYAAGSKLELLGVNAPTENPFIVEIKRLRLYPVTSLRSLNKFAKAELLSRGIMVASDLHYHKQLLQRIGLGDEKITQILREADFLRGHL